MVQAKTHEASQGPRVADGRMAPYNVVVAAPNLQEARRLIEELGRRGGIEANNISLTGPAPLAAATQNDTVRADKEVLTYWLKKTIPFTVAGNVAGFVFGLLLVAILPIEHSMRNFLVASITGLIGGGIGAWFLGGIYYLQPAQPWELTFHQPQSGASYVAVHSERKEDVDLAERILREVGYTNLRRVDSGSAAAAAR